VLAAERDGSVSELICDLLRYVESVQLGVQQPRQTQVKLVSTGKDTDGSTEHSLKLVGRDLWCISSSSSSSSNVVSHVIYNIFSLVLKVIIA